MWMAAPVLAAITIFSNAARADDVAPSAAPADSSQHVVVVQTANGPRAFQLAPVRKTKRVWYGWQTLTLDGVAIASGTILGSGGFNGAGYVWIGTYAIAPPVVHVFHGRVGIAFADLGVRVGAPVVVGTLGLLAGCAAGAGGDDVLDACAVGAVVGFFLGYGAAIAIDAAVFARETVDADPADEDEAREIRKQEAKRATKFSVMPDLGVGQNRATFGLHGQF